MVKFNKCPLVILIGVFLCYICPHMHAQSAGASERADSLMVYYRQGVSDFDAGYKQNGIRCKAFVERFKALHGSSYGTVEKVHIYASASPEGSIKLNETLARERAKSAIAHLHESLSFADSVVTVQIIAEDMDGLAAMVMTDNSLESKDEVLAILSNSSDPMRKAKLQKLDKGRTWDYLMDKYFEELRSFKIYVYFSKESELIHTPVIEFEQQLPSPAYGIVKPAAPTPPPTPAPEAPEWTHALTLKTNLLGIGMGHANIAVEVDLAQHWSVVIPFYYSGGFDYFKPTIKFRGIVLQPQARYYFKGNDGWYIGAHMGLGWYNFALDEEFRIQDYKGRRPAWGGGIGAGYALQFRKNPRWGMEFAIGAGVYDVKYDIFYNEENGPYAESGVYDTFFGVDNAAISFTYKFPFKKEGRK